MSEPIKHHYIPRFYLNRWKSTNDNLLQYFALNKVNKFVTGRVSTKSTAYESFLYTVSDTFPEFSQIIEKECMTKELDGKISPILTKLIENEMKIESLTDKQKSYICRFILSFILRAPPMVKELKKSGEEFLNDLIKRNSFSEESLHEKNLKGLPKGIGLIVMMQSLLCDRQAVSDITNNIYPKLVFNDFTKDYHSILKKLTWHLIRFDENSDELLASDHPFLDFNQEIFLLPLSPRVIFIAADENIINQYKNEAKNNKEELISFFNYCTINNGSVHGTVSI